MFAGLRRTLSRSTALALLIAAMASLIAFAENVDPNNTGAQYAWGENIGWVNFEPSQGPGVTISNGGATGYAWGENVGWINLNCRNNSATCATTKSYGIVRDGTKLGGYAWGENIGWISFSCGNKPSTCAATGNYGVTVNTSTGVLSGRAWGENVGWISFTGGASQVQVSTTQDSDGDGTADFNDVCPANADPSQTNSDRNFVALPHPRFAFDDVTRANSDGWGDLCDTDDDNDGLPDTAEGGAPPCASASGPTSPTNADTDGDRWLDGAECALGFDPANAANHPPYFPPAALDADHDGLPDSFEPSIGADPTKQDSDGDGFSDGIEFMFYGTDPTRPNTDYDQCGDGREIASVNNDTIVSAADLGPIASSFGMSSGPNYVVDFDINKDGIISAADLGLTAVQFGLCP